MDFVVEDLSPVSKKIVLNATAPEVTSAFDKAARHFQKDLQMPGFRRGKAPLSVVERRHAQDILGHVAEEFLHNKLNAYMHGSGITPVAQPQFEPGTLARDEAFTCTVTLEVLPVFELPNYLGLEAEEADANPSEAEIEDSIEHLRRNVAEEQEVTEQRLPRKNDVAVMDFEGFDEEGKAIDDVQGKDFAVTIGEGRVLADFEKLLCSCHVGDTAEGIVNFPADYTHPGLQGKAVTMRIVLKSLKERILPELDDEFAKKYGQETLESLREAVKQSLISHRKKSFKGQSQQTIMEQLLEKADFMLPESLVKIREERILAEVRQRMGRQGAEAEEALEKTLETMQPEARKEAELFTRMHILLLEIARKENLQVSRQEAEMHLYSMAMREGADFAKVRESYERAGLMGELMERILADKAMDFIYDKAVIKTLAAGESSEASPQTPKKKAAKSAAPSDEADGDKE